MYILVDYILYLRKCIIGKFGEIHFSCSTLMNKLNLKLSLRELKIRLYCLFGAYFNFNFPVKL